MSCYQQSPYEPWISALGIVSPNLTIARFQSVLYRYETEKHWIAFQNWHSTENSVLENVHP